MGGLLVGTTVSGTRGSAASWFVEGVTLVHAESSVRNNPMINNFLTFKFHSQFIPGDKCSTSGRYYLPETNSLDWQVAKQAVSFLAAQLNYVIGRK